MSIEVIRFPLDVGGFVRRECPTCHRQFKLKHTEQDGQLVAQRLLAGMKHVNDGEFSRPVPHRHCPYCGARAAADQWFTAEQRAYLEKRSEHWAKQLRYEQLAHPARTLGHNPNVTYLPVSPEPFRVPLRPEPDDLRRFPLLCCRDEVKVVETWIKPVYCVFCGVRYENTRVQPGFLERMGLG